MVKIDFGVLTKPLPVVRVRSANSTERDLCALLGANKDPNITVSPRLLVIMPVAHWDSHSLPVIATAKEFISHQYLIKMAKNMRAANMRAANNPRSGITLLFSELPRNPCSVSCCVSPGVSAMVDNRGRSETRRRQIKYVDAVLDLTKLDSTCV